MDRITKNTFDINKLKSELQSIVEDYNDINNSSSHSNSNISLETKSYSKNDLEKENYELTIEINKIKERLYEKLSQLSNKNKFQYLMNKFIEFYSNKNMDHSDLKNTFEELVNNELSTSNFSDIKVPTGITNNSEYSSEIENLFEKQLKEIRKIQKDKAYFLDSIIQNLDSKNLTNENVIHQTQYALDNIKNDFNIELNYIASKYNRFSNNDPTIDTFKENILNLLSDSIEDLKSEFVNYISFNKFLNQKIEAINNGADPYDKQTFESKDGYGTFDENDNHKKVNSQYANSSLEDKISNLIDAVNNINQKNYDNENKANELINSKIASLEEKFNKLLESIDEKNKNNNVIEEQNSQKIIDKLSLFMESLKSEKNEFLLETKQQISAIINNNENEKKYIVDLLNKIQEDNIAFTEEENLNRTLINSEKLISLEHLIAKQNDEIEELINDKNDAINVIEAMITRTTKMSSPDQETFINIEQNVNRIIQGFEDKIYSLEKTFIDKLEGINSNLPANNTNISSMISNATPIEGERNYQFTNETADEIINNINSVENRLIQNYEAIKLDFNESFNEIINKLNETRDAVLNEKIDALITDVNYIKDSRSSFGLGNEIKDEIREIFNDEINEKLSTLINEKINNNELTAKVGKVENKLNELMSEITFKNDVEFNSLSKRIDNIDNLTKSISDKIDSTSDDYVDIEAKLFENFKRYEDILIHTINKDKDNYKELKNLIHENYLKREEELTMAESVKLQSLNLKLEKLASLIEMQEQEIDALITEKNDVESMISAIDGNINTRYSSEDIQHISNLIEEKIEQCINRTLSSPDNVSNIFKSDNYNELIQVHDKIDELSAYIYENMNVYNNKNSISEILELDLFKNFSNIDFLIKKVESINLSIQDLNINKFNEITNSGNELNDIQSKLNELKYSLLDIELDTSLIKHKLDASNEINSLNDDRRYKDIIVVNRRKLDIITDLIQKNKNSLKELFTKKDEIVKNVDDNQSSIIDSKLLNDNIVNISNDGIKEIELIVDAKANAIIDRLVYELKSTQNNEIEILNKKFDSIKSKLIESHKENQNIDDNWDNEQLVSTMSEEDERVVSEIIDKLEILENNLTDAFNALESKNKELLNEIEIKMEDADVYKQIISKFEEEKAQIKQDYINQTNIFKEYILSLKNDEVNKYKEQLSKLELEINKLKNINYNNEKIAKEQNELIDELTHQRDSINVSKENSLISYKNKIDNLGDQIETLIMQIDSFQEDKEALFIEMDKKLKYLDKLNDPVSENDFIELETDNMETDKFKKIISDDTVKIIEEKFDALKETVTQDVNYIINSISQIREENNNIIDDKFNSLCSEIDKVKNNNSETEKVNKNSEYTLKLINDNILFFVDELERRKEEIQVFYEKINDLKENVEQE